MGAEAWKEWERKVARHAQESGFPWERRLRGGAHRDLLDLDGCLPDGWLVGCKSVRRGKPVGVRLSEAMEQGRRAIANLNQAGMETTGVVAVQVLQRPGFPVGQAYAVVEYDSFLQIAEMRRGWRT